VFDRECITAERNGSDVLADERLPFGALAEAAMPPREFGEKVVSVPDDPKYAQGFAFGLKGDTGITMLEGEAA
jgi:hypothetical protein